MLLVIENVLSKAEVNAFRQQLDSAGWIDGQDTAGSLSRQVKQNQQMPEQSELAVSLGNHILRVLGQHPMFISAALPNKIYPPKFNRYAGGGHYGTHVDGAVMQIRHDQSLLRSDLSATLFLTEPDEYEGGELTIETHFGAQQVKLPAGDMVLYPSSSLHRVEPVTRGHRTSSFFWIQSLVADEAERALLFDLDQTIQALSSDQIPQQSEKILQLTGIYHNLLRRWAKP